MTRVYSIGKNSFFIEKIPLQTGMKHLTEFSPLKIYLSPLMKNIEMDIVAVSGIIISLGASKFFPDRVDPFSEGTLRKHAYSNILKS